MTVSGKYVIISILTVALVAAGTSWWFRYSATHRAAKIWGGSAAALIRAAPSVTLVTFDVSAATDQTMGIEKLRRDVSHAPGMTHLRNALLEDRSYDWTISFLPKGPPGRLWTSALEFRRAADERDAALTLYFSADFRWVVGRSPHESERRSLPCSPIATGLAAMFAELSASQQPAR